MSKTDTTRKTKPDDKRIRPLAELLSRQWDDDCYWSKKFHTACAKEILDLIDGMAR